MFAKLKSEICRANKVLVDAGLVDLTWGNVSGVDRSAGIMAIKPSGIPYTELRPNDIVIVEIENGDLLEGAHRPSSDTPTHLHLYRTFQNIGGIVHMHSRHATAWAQSGRSLPCYGTTHADHFNGSVPITRPLTRVETDTEYERNTGIAIEQALKKLHIAPEDMQGILVHGHAPFVWGLTPRKALDNAIALEVCAQMAFETLLLNPKAQPLPEHILKVHWNRKHGPTAYYGQSK